MRNPKDLKKKHNKPAARKMFIAWYGTIILNCNPTNTTNEAAHDFHDSKATRFMFTEHLHTFLALERVRIPFLVVQPLFHEVFLDNGWRLAQEKRIS